MANVFGINLFSQEKEFRQQVVAALDAISAGTGIADNALALSKLQQIDHEKLLGNRSGTTANVQQVDDVGKWG